MHTVAQQPRLRLQATLRPFYRPSRPLKQSEASCRAAASQATPAEASTVRFAPTRVRVQHDTYIRASRAAVWALLQELTPARKWAHVAVVLATLEAIYGVEYQGLAQQLLAAYQATSRSTTTAAPAGSMAATHHTGQQAHQHQHQQQRFVASMQANGSTAAVVEADSPAGAVPISTMQPTAAAGGEAGGAAAAGSGGSPGVWDHLLGAVTTTSLSSVDLLGQQVSSSNGSSNSSGSSSPVPVPQGILQHTVQQQQQQEEEDQGQPASHSHTPATANAAAAPVGVAAAVQQSHTGDSTAWQPHSMTTPHQQISHSHSSTDLNTAAVASQPTSPAVGQEHEAAMQALAAAPAAVAAAVTPSGSSPVAAPAAPEVPVPDAADAAFMELLLLLAVKAGFVGLSERDVQLGISLNTDYLWQLFVKVNTEQLDGQLVSPFISQAGAADSIMVLRRGYSSEQQRGRWLLQKLDYLQLLLIKRAYNGLLQLSSHTAQQLRSLTHTSQHTHSRNASSSSNNRSAINSKKAKQQQQFKPTVSTPRLPSKDKSAAAECNITAATGSRNGSRNGKALKASARRQSSSSNGSSGSSGRLHPRWPWLSLRRPTATPAVRVDSFGRPYGDAAAAAAAADSIIQPRAGPYDGNSSHSSASSSSDSNSSRDDGGTASTAGQQPMSTTAAAAAAAAVDNTNMSTNSKSSEVPEWVDIDNDTQQQQLRSPQQWQGPRLLSRLRSRVEASLCRAAYTLSDWGLIPRMDVIPLERFEAVFPLQEAARLQPLYIEKATLPDILDPELQARFPWLGPPAQQPTTISSSDNTRSSSSSSTHGTGVASVMGMGQLTAADGGSGRDAQGYAAGEATLVDATHEQRGLLRAFLQHVEIVEPTFRQLLVVYRRKPRVDRWRRLRARLTGNMDPLPLPRRNPIQLQVYRDIPLPSWQVVYPDKLLQFRPLDLLRLDLFGLAGATAALAQAKYNSIVLQLLTLVSVSVWAIRLVLGYLRMDDRYKSIVAQLLADRTVASGEGGLEYIATAAGLQQFKQTALAYVLLHAAETPCGEEEVALAAEALLQQKLQLQVRFNAAEALSELHRFGLLVDKSQRGQSSRATSPTAALATSGNSMQVAPAAAAATVPSDPQQQQQQQGEEEVVRASSPSLQAMLVQLIAAPSQQQQQQPQQQAPLYTVLGSSRSQKVLQQYWAGLLKARVGSILGRRGCRGVMRG